MIPFTKIVCAVDFSGVGSSLLHNAVELAADTDGAALHVLHVVPDPLRQPWAVETSGIDVVALAQAWAEDAAKRLDAMIAAEGAAAKSVVVSGRAADEIVHYAEGVSADLIVMSTHGYGPVKRFMLGSVADRVVRQSTCPVLLIPHAGLEGAEDAARSE